MFTGGQFVTVLSGFNPSHLGSSVYWLDRTRFTLNAGVATVTCTQANAALNTVTVGATTLTEGTDFNRGASDNDCATNLAAAIDALSGFSASAATNVVTITNASTAVSSASEATLTTDDATAFALAGRGYVSADNKFYATCSQWVERIAGLTYTQATASKQPWFVHNSGNSYLLFNGTSHYMDPDSHLAVLDGATGLTMLVRCAFEDTTNAQREVLSAFDVPANTDRQCRVLVLNRDLYGSAKGADANLWQKNYATTLDSTVRTMGFRWSGSVLTLRIDGADQGTDSDPASTLITDTDALLRLGAGGSGGVASYYWKGRIYGAVICTKALTDLETEKVEAYFSNRHSA